MTTKVIVGAVSFSIVLTGFILSNMFIIMMIGEINRKREDGKTISYLGSTFPKIQRIFKEYRNEYPNGRLHIYALSAFAGGMVGLFAVAAALGFFS